MNSADISNTKNTDPPNKKPSLGSVFSVFALIVALKQGDGVILKGFAKPKCNGVM